MRIAIPTTGLNFDSQVEGRFGRAQYFAIVDTDTMELLTALNPACDCQGGAGILAAQVVVDNGVKALLTTSCGKNAADVLQAAEVKLYQMDAQCTTVKDAVERYKAAALMELEDIHAGYHGGS